MEIPVEKYTKSSLIVLFCLLFHSVFSAPKLLHFTFHKGCAKEIEAVGKVLGFEVDTWFIPDLPPHFFDGTSQGNALYNIGRERADRIWKLHRETFERYDGIITSDTAPLSRIFLQNGFSKPLIIWICCRFDYCDTESLDCHFPDPEYYRLFNEAKCRPNVAVIGYTRFEHEYARRKGVDTGTEVIAPCAPLVRPPELHSLIPPEIVKENTFLLFPYQNEMNCKNALNIQIPYYCGRYNGPFDLESFKGIIHLPYAWSNFALFENMALGIPYLLPSPSFLKKLLTKGGCWHMDSPLLIQENRFDLSEWYQRDRRELFIYFDSWEDLQKKTATTDFASLRKKIRAYAEKHQKVMLDRWSKVFSRFFRLA